MEVKYFEQKNITHFHVRTDYCIIDWYNLCE